ncbi:MAG: hypothetical protein ACOZEN_14005 [Thermodesulfobacteriota bacterium]
MNTRKNLTTLTMLVDSVADSLRRVTVLKDEHRKRVIRCAFDDIERAKAFWRDGRVEGLETALGILADARITLAECLKSGVSPIQRGEMALKVLDGVLRALNDIKNTLAGCQEEMEACA